VVAALTYGALVGSLLAELLEDSGIVFTFFIAVGTAVGSWLGLAVSWRRRRKLPVSPWSDVPPVALERYVATGSAVGAVVGFLLALVDALVLG
jgi:hypothetical protein